MVMEEENNELRAASDYAEVQEVCIQEPLTIQPTATQPLNPFQTARSLKHFALPSPLCSNPLTRRSKPLTVDMESSAQSFDGPSCSEKECSLRQKDQVEEVFVFPVLL